VTAVNNTIAGPRRDVVGYNGKPPKVSWPGDARIAISLVVNYEEGSERAVGDGDPTGEQGTQPAWPAGKRDLALESLYEYGSRV
jgi:allantoinase